MPPERRRVIYRGQVQGVGFRYSAARLAPGFLLSGTVRNLPDGDVALEVQGNSSHVRAFVDAIRAEFGPNIEGADETPIPPIPDDASGPFRILH